MSTFLSETKGFTPVIDVLARELGLMTAVVYGIAWRYCQMENRVCSASRERIAEHAGISSKTVERHLKNLCEAGYLRDTTPDHNHKPHVYADTGKAKITSLIAAEVGTTESPTRLDRESDLGKTESPTMIPSYEREDDTTTYAGEKAESAPLKEGQEGGTIPKLVGAAEGGGSTVGEEPSCRPQKGGDDDAVQGQETSVESRAILSVHLAETGGREGGKGSSDEKKESAHKLNGDTSRDNVLRVGETGNADASQFAPGYRNGHSDGHDDKICPRGLSDEPQKLAGRSPDSSVPSDGGQDVEEKQEVIRHGRISIAVGPDGNGTIVHEDPPWVTLKKPTTHGGFYLQELLPDWQGFNSVRQRNAFQRIERKVNITRFEEVIRCAIGKKERGDLVGDVVDAIVAIAKAHPEKAPFEKTPQGKDDLEDDSTRHPLYDDPFYQPTLTPTAVAALREDGCEVSPMQGGGFYVKPPGAT